MTTPQIRGTIKIDLFEGGGDISVQIIELLLTPQGLATIPFKMTTHPWKDGDNITDLVNKAVRDIRTSKGVQATMPENTLYTPNVQ